MLDPDIIILTEHGQKKEVLKNTRLIGYSLTAEYCREHHIKGGVAIYVKEPLREYTEVIDMEDYCIELTCEVAIVKIKLGKASLIVIGVYRSSRNLDAGLETIMHSLDKASTDKNHVILIGDVNIDCLDKKLDYTKMKDILTSYNMSRLDLPATRVTPTSKSSIDCICTNLKHEELSAAVINTGIADHKGQLCTLKLSFESNLTPSTSEHRHMNYRNLQKLKNTLGEQDWSDTYNTYDVNECYNNFSRTLQEALNQTCPIVKSRHSKKYKPTLADPTARLMKQRFIEAQNKYNTSGRKEDKQNATILKRDYDLRLKLLRRQSTVTNIMEAENKSKALWRAINSERIPKEKTNLPTKLDIHGEQTTDPIKMANYLNNFFTNIAEDTIKTNGQYINNLILPPDNPTIPSLLLHPTNKHEMANIINSIKPKTSAGYDGISSKILKICKNELMDPLIDITNKSFATGVFPSKLKIAKVYPKFKQGDPTKALNYRPISLIPTFSKLIEKIVLARLHKHLSSNRLLSTQQHGFQAGRSTTTALINLTEFLIDQIEEGNTATAILLDYSKAFDCLSHHHLLAKLSHLGIRGTAQQWFSSYLTERHQTVELQYKDKNSIHYVQSELKNTTRGVPQGSVLGPLLFILFTNDFPNYMDNHCTSLMFADDTVLLLSKNQPEQLEVASHIAFNMAIQYCHGNDLVVNESKSKQLVIGNHQEVVGRLPDVEDLTFTKYLGVIIDNALTWTPHIDLLCNKLNVAIYVIRRMKCISDTQTAKVAYHALFESHLRYGLVVWGGTTAYNLQRVLLHQKRAIRTLLNLQLRESCRNGFKELKILTAVSLYILEVIIYTHTKATNAPKTGAQLHNYNTRRNTDYNLPAHHLSHFEKKPTYIGAKLWNNLPEELKRVNSTQLKKHLKDWLMVHPFYTLAEYQNWRTTDLTMTE